MRVELITEAHKYYLVKYMFCGYAMERTILATSARNAKDKLREIISVDEVLSVKSA